MSVDPLAVCWCVLSHSVTLLLCLVLVLLCTFDLHSIGATIPAIVLFTNRHFFSSECILCVCVRVKIILPAAIAELTFTTHCVQFS